MDGTFELPAEQAMVVADEDSPVFLGGAFESIAACYADHDIFVDAFRTSAGVGWQEYDERVVLRRPAAVPATLLTSSTSGFLHWTAWYAGQAVAALRLVAAAVGRAAEARRRGKLGRCQ